MVLKKDPSWLNLATEVVQIPLALSPQHFQVIVYNVELSLIFKSSAVAPSNMNKQVVR